MKQFFLRASTALTSTSDVPFYEVSTAGNILSLSLLFPTRCCCGKKRGVLQLLRGTVPGCDLLNTAEEKDQVLLYEHYYTLHNSQVSSCHLYNSPLSRQLTSLFHIYVCLSVCLPPCLLACLPV